MNRELVSLLRCPKCGGGFEFAPSVVAEDGELSCVHCSARFPVVRNIPRLANESYTASFGRQWNKFEVVRADEDHSTFRVKTGVDPADLAGKLVLDAGCGGGRYSRLVAAHRGRVIGVDLSTAVEKAGELCREYPGATIVQTDLLHLPIAESTFDFVFSIGVLHHSSDPREAFHQIAARVRPGGKLAVWLYRRNTFPQEALNSLLRTITTRLPSRVLEYACVGLALLGSIPILNRTLNKVVNFSNHPDWTLRVCDTFDWYSPRYQSHHTEAELRRWFTEEGYEDITPLPPARSGRLYDWAYRQNLIIGSGVNMVGTRRCERVAQ